jgi:hypothetical protein
MTQDFTVESSASSPRRERDSPIIDPKNVCRTYHEQSQTGDAARSFSLDAPDYSTIIVRRRSSSPKPEKETQDAVPEIVVLDTGMHDLNVSARVHKPRKSALKQSSTTNSSFSDLSSSSLSRIRTPGSESAGSQRGPSPYAYSLRILQRSLPALIRNRAEGLEAEPLYEAWTFPQGARYYIGDTQAMKVLAESNIIWCVNTGILEETPSGLMWAALGTYLLFNCPPDSPGSSLIEHITRRDFKREAKERYEKRELWVPADRPATPIVEGDNPMSRPPTPRTERRVRFNRWKRCLDPGTGVTIHEIVTDNEGKTESVHGRAKHPSGHKHFERHE